MNEFNITCPECDYQYSVEEPMVGEVIKCGDCGLSFGITTIDQENKTVDLELAEVNSEDWGQ